MGFLSFVFGLLKVLQQEQTATIRELERDTISLRVKHADAIQEMKTKYVTERQEYQIASQQKIADLTKQANKVSNLQ